MTAANSKTAHTPGVTVRTNAEGIARCVSGCSVVIEQARGPSYFGETGQPRDFWNLCTPTNRTPLAQSESKDALLLWAKKNGAKRAEVL